MIDTLHLKTTPSVRVAFSSVCPGQVFERPNGGVPAKAHRFLKLKAERSVDLFENDLAWVPPEEVVTVIGSLV